MRSVFMLGVLVLTSSAYAGNIDFSDLSSGECASLASSVNSGGFNFATSSPNDGLYLCNPGVLQNNPTPAMIAANDISVVTMTQVGGAPFSFESFSAGARTEDFSLAARNPAATGIDVLGTFFGGGTVSTQFSFTTATSWDFFVLPGTFTNLTSVTLTALGTSGGQNQEFAFNNLTVNSDTSGVPEPGSMALMGMGLAGLSIWRLRRKQS